MKARDLEFSVVRDEAIPAHREFVCTHHYSKACPPGRYWFRATHGGKLVGVILFRKPSLPKTGIAYGVQLELSRLVMLDQAGKNSESRFIGFALRWLAQHSDASAVVSFADPRAGHEGTVYRASNWSFMGKEKGHGTRRIIVDGEELHSKTAYDRWGLSGAALIAHLAPRKVEILVCPPKNVFTYQLRRMYRPSSTERQIQHPLFE